MREGCDARRDAAVTRYREDGGVCRWLEAGRARGPEQPSAGPPHTPPPRRAAVPRAARAASRCHSNLLSSLRCASCGTLVAVRCTGCSATRSASGSGRRPPPPLPPSPRTRRIVRRPCCNTRGGRSSAVSSSKGPRGPSTPQRYRTCAWHRLSLATPFHPSRNSSRNSLRTVSPSSAAAAPDALRRISCSTADAGTTTPYTT